MKMGLDMYLEKCNRKVWGFKDFDIENVKANNPKLYEELKPFITVRGNYYKWESLFAEVGYWRKANAIHRWFVDNVQNEIDDCNYYEVSKEKAQELLDICKRVKAETILEKGMVENGYTFDDNGKKCPILEEGLTMVNPEIAEELLPTQSGFFFGGTNYDEYYMQDIDATIEILTKSLEETDFDMEMLVYSSSW